MECIKCRRQLPEGAVFCLYCGKKQEAPQRKHAKRANGTGSISKLSGGRKKPWLARKNGVSLGTFTTRAEAQKALERLTDVDVNEKFNMTFKQIYNAWLPEHERTISKSQRGCYVTAFNQCAALHDRQYRQLRRSDFQAVIIELEQANKSKSTCEKVLQLYSKLAGWAIDEGIVQVNHAKNVRTVAQQLSQKKAFLKADIEAIEQSGLRAAPIALIMLGCGCRPNELFNALLVNCHEDYFIGGSKTKAGKNRVIMVSSVGLEAYQKLRKEAMANRCQKLIDAYAGNRQTANFAKRDFAQLMAEIGREDMTPHSCRHTFITNAIRAGVDLPVLQQMVGHVDGETTRNYTHLDVTDLRDAAAKIKHKTAVCNKSATWSEAQKKAM